MAAIQDSQSFLPTHVATTSSALFTAALLKVASRCNLDCDYCYVYKHADQSWRSQPKLMSTETVERFSVRLREYLDVHQLREFSVTFHGGEPLLFGGPRLTSATKSIRDAAGDGRSISFSLQTNGTLLTEELISQFELSNIDVSISLDGPRWLNDRHRPDHGGNSSFDATLEALRRLKRQGERIFTGVIAVIDPTITPRELFEFFSPLDLPRLDLLLPDATHARLPPGRNENRSLYADWLNEAIELWFHEYSNLPVRWFDAILGSRLGVPSPTDAMGLGAVNLLVIDTDGSYTDHDVFKITEDGRAAIGKNLVDMSFEEVSHHSSIAEHSFRLTLDGLAAECRSCPVVEACGGGSVMHRWHPARGLAAPSVYCPELFGVMETATRLLKKSIVRDVLSPLCSVAGFRDRGFLAECERWRHRTEARATAVASQRGLARSPLESAAAILMASDEASSGGKLHKSSPSPRYWMDSIRVQSSDSRLVTPFLKSIRLLPEGSREVLHGMTLLKQVTPLLAELELQLPEAFQTLITDVLFVESTIESRDQIFSFSDDSAPNVLYVSPFMGAQALGPDDLGDSLLHEFFHQVLYHMERDEPMLLDHVYPRFPAPWRDGLRPAGGFLHGTFVFAGLSQYWAALSQSGRPEIDVEKASQNAARFRMQAAYGVKSLRQFALVTRRGEALLDQIATGIKLNQGAMVAPCFTSSGGCENNEKEEC